MTTVGPRPLAAYNYLITRGLRDIAAAAAVGGAMVEDYDDLQTEAQGDRKLGTGHEAHGAFQWRESRWEACQAFAKSQGKDVGDLLTEFAFFMHEINTTEKRVGLALGMAKTLEEAVDAMIRYERPAGYPPPRGVPSWHLRFAKAQAVLDAARPK